jgi:hypothetical protein
LAEAQQRSSYCTETVPMAATTIRASHWGQETAAAFPEAARPCDDRVHGEGIPVKPANSAIRDSSPRERLAGRSRSGERDPRSGHYVTLSIKLENLFRCQHGRGFTATGLCWPAVMVGDAVTLEVHLFGRWPSLQTAAGRTLRFKGLGHPNEQTLDNQELPFHCSRVRAVPHL